MKIKNIKKATASFLLIVVICLTACDSFLEEESLGDATTDAVYSTESGYNALITSCYSVLRDVTKEWPVFIEGTDLFTRNLKEADDFLNDYSASSLNASNTYISNIWEILYIGIQRCNTAIDRVDDVENMDETTLQQRYAEAVFLRALFYFFLVQEFGDIPYHDHEVTGIETDVTRISEATIYANIIADLESIKDVLPTLANQDADDAGRASWESVRYLMAQVYLTRGWDYNGNLGSSDSDFSTAASYADDIIESRGALTLEPAEIYFKNGDTHGTNNDDNSEVIFSFRFSDDQSFNSDLDYADQEGNDSHSVFIKGMSILNGIISSSGSFYGGGLKGYYQATRYSSDILHPEMRGFDKRYSCFFRDAITAEEKVLTSDGDYVSIGDTVLYYPGVEDGEAYADGTVFHSADVLANNPHALIYTPSMYDPGTEIDGYAYWIPLWKHFEPNNTNVGYGSRDLLFMKLGGAYLLSAEAHLKAGNAATAAERYTEVRARSIDLSKSPTGVDPDARTAADITIDDILDERARELAGENHRWFDLKRTKTLYERTIKYNLRTNNTGNLAADNTDMYYLRPIPRAEIERTNIEQNPGY